MERFIDDLSRQLSTAVSRRDMVNITSKAIVAALLPSIGISKLWGQSFGSSKRGGSSACAGVQRATQLGFPDPSQYPNHGAYIKAIAHSVVAAQKAQLIAEDCSECIVEQFAEEVPIGQQKSCGSLIAPTQTCSTTNPSAQQIQTAGVLSLVASPNAWSDPAQWVQLTQLAEAMLGCLISSTQQTASSASSVSSNLSSTALSGATTQGSTSCSTPGVNYCGPGNSLDIGPFAGSLPSVAPCLNNGCFEHDNCYAAHCISGSCYWTTQTAACDAGLLSICKGVGPGSCSLTDLLQPGTAFVCGIVECLTGGVAIPVLNTICQGLLSGHSTLTGCTQPAPICLSCPSGESPCGDTCCPCGTTCANGSCAVCANGDTLCPTGAAFGGFICCSPDQTCQNGQCVTSCPSGTTPCGTTCCSSGQTCSNGQCVSSSCPPGTTPCGTTCCSSGQTCSNGQCVSSSCPPGTTPCGTACCAANQNCQSGQCVSVCPSGQTSCGGYCCDPSANLSCCGGQTCCLTTALCCEVSNSPGLFVCCGANTTTCAFAADGIVYCT
jgi:hypothetical protein